MRCWHATWAPKIVASCGWSSGYPHGPASPSTVARRRGARHWRLGEPRVFLRCGTHRPRSRPATSRFGAFWRHAFSTRSLMRSSETLPSSTCNPWKLLLASMPGIASGELMTAIAMTEPGTGSDLAGIRTTATRDGDHYVLNGAKTFITGGLNTPPVAHSPCMPPGSPPSRNAKPSPEHCAAQFATQPTPARRGPRACRCTGPTSPRPRL